MARSNSKYLHYCVEWDDMQIDETDSEIACCLCFDEPEFKEMQQKWIKRIWPEYPLEE